MMTRRPAEVREKLAEITQVDSLTCLWKPWKKISQVKKEFKIQVTYDAKRSLPRHILNKFLDILQNNRILKESREKRKKNHI